jgi:hypothetical protein
MMPQSDRDRPNHRRWGSGMPDGCAGWRNSPCHRARGKKEIMGKILKKLDFISKKQRDNSGRNSG